MLEGADDVIGDDRFEIVRDGGEGIEADRTDGVGRVDVDEIVGAGSRDLPEHVLGKIAVRIEERQALALREVLRDQVEEQRRLSGAGLADDVEVAAPLVRVERHEFARYAGAEAELL